MNPRGNSGLTTLRGYGLAALCTGVAVMMTIALRNPLFPTPLFFAAVVIATWYGGALAGLVTVALATASLDYYFLRPESFVIFKGQLMHLLDFVLPAVLTFWFVRKRKIAEETFREERDELESQIEERQAELARVSRLLTIGEMGVSIAHEVNQPLVAIVLNADACLRWLDGNSPNLDEARAAASRIAQEGSRAGEVVRRIRNLAQNAASERVALNLNELVQDSLSILDREALRYRVTLRSVIAPDLPPIRGDRVQLQQVILNLVMNAFEAMTGKLDFREVVIRTQPEGTTAVLVSIEDSGPGLPDGDPEQVFGPFFTTKPGGIGIGLSLSRSIIESHGGRLWATSGGAGAIFTVRLPIATGESQ